MLEVDGKHEIMPKLTDPELRKIGFQILSIYPDSVQKIHQSLRIYISQVSNYKIKGKKYASRIKPGPKGLKNFGNTCYLNSILQLLYSIPSIRSKILSFKSNLPMISSLRYIFAKLSFSLLSSVRTHSFIRNFLDYDDQPIDQNIQMDAEEFFLNLLSKLEDCGLKTIEEDITIRSTRIIRCQACKKESKKTEFFNVLSLDVRGNLDVYDCIKSATKHDVLNGENQYFCEDCEGKVDAEKFLNFEKLPNFLIISLKRLIYDVSLQKMVKIYDKCQFYKELDFDIGGQEKFSLKGIIVHIGDENSGHYVAVMKEGELWYKFDDEIVAVLMENEVDIDNLQMSIGYNNKKCTAYMVLYQKVLVDEEKPGVLYENNAEIQKIINKNSISLTSKLFFSQEFTVFISEITKSNTFIYNALEIYFTLFIYSEENHKIVFETIYKGFLSALNNSANQAECLRYILKNIQVIIDGLSGKAEIHHKAIGTNIIKKIISYLDSNSAKGLFYEFYNLFCNNHVHYNFTFIIDVMVCIMNYFSE